MITYCTDEGDLTRTPPPDTKALGWVWFPASGDSDDEKRYPMLDRDGLCWRRAGDVDVFMWDGRKLRDGYVSTAFNERLVTDENGKFVVTRDGATYLFDADVYFALVAESEREEVHREMLLCEKTRLHLTVSPKGLAAFVWAKRDLLVLVYSEHQHEYEAERIYDDGRTTSVVVETCKICGNKRLVTGAVP